MAPPSTLHRGEICAVCGLKLIEPPLKRRSKDAHVRSKEQVVDPEVLEVVLAERSGECPPKMGSMPRFGRDEQVDPAPVGTRRVAVDCSNGSAFYPLSRGECGGADDRLGPLSFEAQLEPAREGAGCERPGEAGLADPHQ